MFSYFLQCLFLLSAPGGSEWILIILAVLILFGGRKIPEFMKGLGRGMREFNDAKNNDKRKNGCFCRNMKFCIGYLR